jgi:hypothetical protein
MLDQVGDLEGLVAQAAVLEVDKPAALAVPEEVGDVPIALAKDLSRVRRRRRGSGLALDDGPDVGSNPPRAVAAAQAQHLRLAGE